MKEKNSAMPTGSVEVGGGQVKASSWRRSKAGRVLEAPGDGASEREGGGERGWVGVRV